jgi:hypothetical protein
MISTPAHCQLFPSFRRANFTPTSDQLIHANAMEIVVQIDVILRKKVESVVPNVMVVTV